MNHILDSSTNDERDWRYSNQWQQTRVAGLVKSNAMLLKGGSVREEQRPSLGRGTLPAGLRESPAHTAQGAPAEAASSGDSQDAFPA